MQDPEKSFLWKLGQSWYLLFALTLIFNWVAFFYTGQRARNTRWIVWGGVYAVPFTIGMFTANHGPFLIGLYWISYVASVIHLFTVRKEYLMRLQMLENSGQDTAKLLKRRLESEFKAIAQDLAAQESIVPQEPPQAQQTHSEHQPPHRTNGTSTIIPQVPPLGPDAPPVDLNNAPEEQLALLPGVSPTLAKKAVTEREQRGGFESLEAFCDVLGIKPPHMERIRAHTTVKPLEKQQHDAPGGRLVD
ncbi:MAG TPA: helix-hairpin-helix domain-containing protein [Bacilli bacterium]|nr:helix-hairpin-helix domain-containing protein [Bacilli bacterium]